jgi:NTP pyrophosphatase (non-canonical NTP hydrolase)
LSDDETTLGELKKRVAKFRDDRDWKKFHNPKDLAVSISIEAGELMELFQWKTEAEIRALLQNEGKVEDVRDELADVVVYCLSLSNHLGLDLSDAVKKKMEKSALKYPVEKAKGNARKYTEL